MSRARSGSIDRVSNGYRVRMTTPKGDREPLGTFPTWEEAEAVRLAAVEALERRPGGNVQTLRDFGDAWLETRDRAKEIRNVDGYRSVWNTHVLTHDISDMPMRAIRPAHLDELVRALREKGLAVQTVRNVLTVVRGVLRSAMRRGLLKLDPFAGGVPIAKEARTVEPWTYATPDEQRAILDACKGNVRHLVAFAMTTGLRAGELVALRLVDVHEDHVVVRYGGAPELPTKSGKIRRVYLNALAKEALDAWVAELATFTASKKHPHGRNPLGLAFPGRHGAFRCEEHVIRWEAWKAILERAGITRRFRWHDLRHTCASSLVSGWWGRRWSLEEVREVLGHSEIGVTQRYAHLASDAIALAAKQTTGAVEVVADAAAEVAPEIVTEPESAPELATELATTETPIAQPVEIVAPPAEIESATFGLGNRCSIH